ncbi:YfiR family protein [Pseudomarimonas salicorniae]|uniref:YfiR family protein n=1 Tax=Pseudomarimonas salicorniae TaxID=2933270 RepID=A0ABT0GFI7_9GAMM|nr:YfiR family protein [Lysobacter sp. CAU 1642]MCK7593300.1 YfiR family protein [Lysobacter sp. CAU 1642]
MRLPLQLLLVSLALLASAAQPALSASEREAAIRAAFLYRLSFFVHWPEGELADPGAPISVCVVAAGESEVFRQLELGARRWKIGERPMRVQLLAGGAALEGCHIAYIEGDLPAARLPGQLVVVESMARLDGIGDLALVATRTEDGGTRLGFHADRQRLARARFSLSSQLMQLLSFRAERPGDPS